MVDEGKMIPAGATLGNSVLLVIDVINSCTCEEYEDPARRISYNRIRQMVPSLSAFITSFKQLGGKVVLMTCVPWQEQYLPDNINELYRNSEKARYWSRDTRGHAEQFHKISTDGAIVFAKNSYDAFTSKEFVALLEEMQTRYIIVTGVFGDGCVMATICGGFSKGYHFIIAKDLIETTDDEERQILQRYLKERTWPLMYGTTVESHHILSAFSQKVG
ncbi:MAG: isochorismatase family cysteine hydrolase [Chloroflexota bacterium]